MPFLLIVPAAIVFSAMAVMSYAESTRQAGWFVWLVGPALGALNLLRWCLACKWSSDHRSILSLSYAWDAVAIVAYSVLPLWLFGIRLGPVAWAGLVMVVVGAVMVKVGG